MGTRDEEEVMALNEEGEINIVEDGNWGKGFAVWELIHGAQL